jgi:hypothetical protein
LLESVTGGLRHVRCNDCATGVTIDRATMETLKFGARGGKTVRRLDEFPELERALRDRGLLMGRLFCAQLLHFDEPQNLCERARERPVVPSP